MTDNELILSTAIAKFGELLSSSEERINRTNEMVFSLAETSRMQLRVMEEIRETYTHHVDALVTCRDKLVKQNGELISIVSHSQEKLDKMDSRFQMLFDRLLEKVSAGQNVSKSEVKIV